MTKKIEELFDLFPDYEYLTVSHFSGVAMHKEKPSCYNSSIFASKLTGKELGHKGFSMEDFPIEESRHFKQCADCVYDGQGNCNCRLYYKYDYDALVKKEIKKIENFKKWWKKMTAKGCQPEERNTRYYIGHRCPRCGYELFYKKADSFYSWYECEACHWREPIKGEVKFVSSINVNPLKRSEEKNNANK